MFSKWLLSGILILFRIMKFTKIKLYNLKN